MKILLFMGWCLSCFSEIPPYLWQTYKTTALPPTALETRQTWTHLNPEFSCFLFDDLDIENYMKQNWPPEFLTFFSEFPIGTMKADLWRYLIIASEGGVYSDIDSVCLLPIREWIVQEPIPTPHLLLIDLDCNPAHFCQWTFAATPKHPAMYYICHYVLNQWKQRKGLVYEPDGRVDVLATTGPAIFSQAIRSYIGEPINLKASLIVKKYREDAAYRERLNRLGIFFTKKGFFSGQASKNLFWGSWGRSAEGS